MKRSLLIGLFSLTLMLNACKSSIVEQQSNSSSNAREALNQLKGTWILKRRFLSDAYDTPCGYATQEQSRDITLTFTDEIAPNSASDTLAYTINGVSTVNYYMGTIKIKSFSGSSVGTIKIGAFASTKMAGTPEMNNCEMNYFDFLSHSSDFSLVNNADNVQELRLGNFYHGTTPSRDGGTYLIFERSK